MKVGFIGLGNMGGPMARNILKAGHELTVYNRTASKMAPLAELGARTATSPREAAMGAEIVCTCVSVPAALWAVVEGPEGVLAGMKAGQTLVDFSTVDPGTSQRLAELCTARGIGCLDAPVSGGTAGAEAGTLTVVVGGPQETFEKANPVFAAVGKNIVHVGGPGAGSAFKLINQILVGVNLAGVLEAFVLARKAGLDLNVLYQVLSTSAGNSNTLQSVVPDRIIGRDFEGGFMLKLLIKDLDLALQMSKDSHSTLFVASVARQLYEQATIAGYGDKNMAAAILPMEHLQGMD
ncbi:MAG: NAD(P)-dependent oxidoreductase [Anaerolineales bacterium]